MDPEGGYDWGACVMADKGLYRMWWTRPSPRSTNTHPYRVKHLGKWVEIPCPARGDRIYYSESADGRTWRLGDEPGPGSVRTAEDPEIILTPSETAAQRRHVGCPSVVKVRGTYYMYYEAPSEFEVRTNAFGYLEVGQEYQNQVFLATSLDGRHFRKWPSDTAPTPVIAAPEENLAPGRHRYGRGQPSIAYRKGKFVLHYVDSCAWWPDTIVRVESEDPYFRTPEYFRGGLVAPDSRRRLPPDGAVAKFAQTDVAWSGEYWVLVRPVYGTGAFGLLASRDGVFRCDDASNDPRHCPVKVAVPDARGPAFLARMYPRFLRTPHGELVRDDDTVSVFCGSGRSDGPGWPPSTWDIHRVDIRLRGNLRILATASHPQGR